MDGRWMCGNSKIIDKCVCHMSEKIIIKSAENLFSALNRKRNKHTTHSAQSRCTCCAHSHLQSIVCQMHPTSLLPCKRKKMISIIAGLLLLHNHQQYRRNKKQNKAEQTQNFWMKVERRCQTTSNAVRISSNEGNRNVDKLMGFLFVQHLPFAPRQTHLHRRFFFTRL